jgi:hypothetical protein
MGQSHRVARPLTGSARLRACRYKPVPRGKDGSHRMLRDIRARLLPLDVLDGIGERTIIRSCAAQDEAVRRLIPDWRPRT